MTRSDQIRQWASVLDHSNYYEILGLLQIADEGAIKDAYHQFALAFHPDAHRDAPREDRDLVTRIFQQGAEAYRTLSHPQLRAKYDLALARSQIRLTRDPSAPSPGAQGGPANGGKGAPRTQGNKPAAPPAAATALEDLCSSPGARMLARRAEEQIASGDLRSARDTLRQALSKDGDDNEALEDRIEDLDMALFAQGG